MNRKRERVIPSSLWASCRHAVKSSCFKHFNASAVQCYRYRSAKENLSLKFSSCLKGDHCALPCSSSPGDYWLSSFNLPRIYIYIYSSYQTDKLSFWHERTTRCDRFLYHWKLVLAMTTILLHARLKHISLPKNGTYRRNTYNNIKRKYWWD